MSKSTPPKILIVGKYLPPFKGGIERFTLRLYEGLRAAGFPVKFMGFGPQDRRFIRIPSLGRIFSQELFWPKSEGLFAHFDQVRLVILNNPNPLMDFYLFFRPTKAKTIIFHHSEILGRSFLRWLLRPFLVHSLKNARCIVVSSKKMAERPSLKAFRHKVHVIPFGTPEPPPRPPSSGKAYLLFVGRLVPYKGLHFLLHALKDLNIPTKIVGTGPCKLELLQLRSKLSLDDQVEFLGEVDSNRLDQLYRDCSFFVLPSHTEAESFGITLIEAMSYGKPLITCDLGTGVNEVNRDGVTGLVVPPKDPVELSLAIQKLWHYPEARLKMGEHARQVFLENYQDSQMIDQWTQLIHKLDSDFIKKHRHYPMENPHVHA